MAEHFDRRKPTREQLASIDRRSWHLWAVSLVVTLSLAVAIAALLYPALRWGVVHFELRGLPLPQLVVGLVALVFLLGLYIVAKQRELNELRNFIIATYVESGPPGNQYPKDALTGLLDRRALPDILERETAWVRRYRIPLCLVLYDIRGFSKINEKQGNLAGDLVLKDLAEALEATARQSDTILRHGPDEFLCFLPRTDPAGVTGFAQRVEKTCQKFARLRGVALDFGIAEVQAGLNSDVALAEAEQSLAAVKGATVSGPAPLKPSGQPA